MKAKEILLKYYNSTNESMPYSSTSEIWKVAALCAMNEFAKQEATGLIKWYVNLGKEIKKSSLYEDQLIELDEIQTELANRLYKQFKADK